MLPAARRPFSRKIDVLGARESPSVASSGRAWTLSWTKETVTQAERLVRGFCITMIEDLACWFESRCRVFQSSGRARAAVGGFPAYPLPPFPPHPQTPPPCHHPPAN